MSLDLLVFDENVVMVTHKNRITDPPNPPVVKEEEEEIKESDIKPNQDECLSEPLDDITPGISDEDSHPSSEEKPKKYYVGRIIIGLAISTVCLFALRSRRL